MLRYCIFIFFQPYLSLKVTLSYQYFICHDLEVLIYCKVFFTGGHYLYLETSSTIYGDAAVLRSKLFPAVEDAIQMCFHYYMYGPTVNQLRILKLVNNTRTQLWQMHGNQGPQWIQASVNVSGDQPYYVSSTLL